MGRTTDQKGRRRVRELSVASNAAEADQNSAVDFMFANARTGADHVTVRRRVAGRWRDVTARQFAREVTDFGKGLIAAGIDPGDRVAIMSKTRYEWSVADMAALAIGAVVVPIYETSSAEQVEWILADSGAKAALVETADHAKTVESVRDRAPALDSVWTIEGDGLTRLIESGTAVADEEVERRRLATRRDDLASIIYTSGTTGRPKGCELTHGNFVAEVAELQYLLSDFFNDSTSTLLFLPIAHVFGRAIEMGTIAKLCTLGHAGDVKDLVSDLGEFKPTFVLSVPRVFEKVYNTAKQRAQASGKGAIFDRAEQVAIKYSEGVSAGRVSPMIRLQHAVFDRLVYSKLRAALGGECVAAISGGAPLGERLGHFFRGLGVTIYEGYGLTETTAGIYVNRPGELKVGAVGKPVGGTTVRVADDGELLVKGAVVFRGYWRNEDATAAAIDADGWFHTGDIGELDDEGFVTITGRKKEIIVTAAGKNVAPATLEDRIRAHWLVSQCLVVGDRMPYIAALITIDPEALPQWLAKAGKPASTTMAELVDDPALIADVQSAVDDANRAVSHAEAIKRFTILPIDWTEEGGQVTPSLKLKRNVVQAECAEEIAQLYARARD